MLLVHDCLASAASSIRHYHAPNVVIDHPRLVARPLRGQISCLALRSAPRTSWTRCVSSPTSVPVVSASVSSGTCDVAAPSRGTPSVPAWPVRPHTFVGMPRFLFTVRDPPFSTHLLRFPSPNPLFMPIALVWFRQSWPLVTPSFVVVDPTSAWASPPFVVVVSPKSSWPSRPRSSVVLHRIPVSAS